MEDRDNIYKLINILNKLDKDTLFEILSFVDKDYIEYILRKYEIQM